LTSLTEWKFIEDGEVMAEGALDPEGIEPQQEKVVHVDLPERKPGKEYFLNLAAVTKEKYGIIDKGTVLASEQIPFPEYQLRNSPVNQSASLDRSGARTAKR